MSYYTLYTDKVFLLYVYTCALLGLIYMRMTYCTLYIDNLVLLYKKIQFLQEPE